MSTPLQLRSSVATLARMAERDLASTWRVVSTADEAKAALTEVLADLVPRYGSAAAAVAADWYDGLRDEAGIGGRFAAITADLDDLGTDALAGWGVGPLYSEQPDWDAARSLISGGTQRRIANAARDTVTISAVEDPRAAGWRRAGTGRCGFCRMLIGRGAVYRERTADFNAHDHCGCVAVPVFTS